jgi:hypothetical protein
MTDFQRAKLQMRDPQVAGAKAESRSGRKQRLAEENKTGGFSPVSLSLRPEEEIEGQQLQSRSNLCK